MPQDSREALIELLFASLYLDNHLSLSEDDVRTSALVTLGWESSSPRKNFVFKAFSSAREATACDLNTEEFLSDRVDRIKADGMEGPALTWLYRVLGADGISPSEQRVLSLMEKRFYP